MHTLPILSNEETQQPPNEAVPPSGSDRPRPTIGVRYGAMNYVGEFAHRSNETFNLQSEKVVVQTDRGMELGEILPFTCQNCGKTLATQEQIRKYVKNSGPEFYQPRAGRVLRKATPDDINDHQHLNANISDDLHECRTQGRRFGLELKLVTAEHLLGGERIVFYFRSEERIDFRELVRELARRYQTRIEMRQVGARDEARLVADWEICGRECCCKNFLKKLRPVSMKMAKLQKSTLDPTKVSGRCGRLRCCLRYEHVGYEELARQLPKRGAWVRTAAGDGAVVDSQVLTQLLLVQLEDQRRIAFPLEEIEVLGKQPPKPEPAEAKEPAPDSSSQDSGSAKPSRGRRRRRKPTTTETPPSKADASPPTTPDATPTPSRDATEGGSRGDGAEGSGGLSRSARRRRRRRRNQGGDDAAPPANDA